MGFWEYPDSSSDDDDSGSQDEAVRRSRCSPNLNRWHHKKLSDLENFDTTEKAPKKEAVVEPVDDDIISPPHKKKRKSVLKKISLEQECVPGAQTNEAIRLQELRNATMKAFQDIDDEDDEDDVGDEANAQAACPQAPVEDVVEIDDVDEDDVEAELEAEQQLLLRQGHNAASSAKKMALKVQCKSGSVQIWQQAGSNFVELIRKFRDYAVQQGWAKKSSKMVLECDGDRVDPEGSTPEDFELEDGMAIDVVIK